LKDSGDNDGDEDSSPCYPAVLPVHEAAAPSDVGELIGPEKGDVHASNLAPKEDDEKPVACDFMDDFSNDFCDKRNDEGDCEECAAACHLVSR